MTLDMIRDQIWWLTGEDTDLDPDTDVSYSGGPLLTWVANEGQRQIASYKAKDGSFIKFRHLVGEFYFKTHVITGTLGADGSSTTVTFPPADVGGDDDRYNGWLVEINSETKMIVDYDGDSYQATVHSSWDTTPSSGDSYSLYKRFNLLLPSSHSWVGEHASLPVTSDTYRAEGNFVTLLKVTDIDNGTELERGSRIEDYTNNLTATGDPTAYILKGNRIVFNYASDEQRWYLADYYRLPTEMSNDTDVPEIPEMFHYGIILWGRWWTYERDQEKGAAYTAKRDFEDFMERTKSNYEVQFDRIDNYGLLEKS
jgi:hypothetical protein